jgi:hypothetical protein
VSSKLPPPTSEAKKALLPSGESCLLLGGFASHAAQSHVVPFKVTGGGTAPEGLSVFGATSPHNATGTATHLGEYSGNEGVAEALSFDFRIYQHGVPSVVALPTFGRVVRAPAIDNLLGDLL